MRKQLAVAITMVMALTSNLSADSVKSGDWMMVTSKDLVENITTYLIASADQKPNSQYNLRPYMGIQCTVVPNRYRDLLFFKNLDVLNGDVWHFRTNLMDKSKTVWGSEEHEGSGGLSQGLPLAGWNNVDETHGYMLAGDTMYIKFNSYARDDQIVTISLEGFDEALYWLRDKCIVKKKKKVKKPINNNNGNLDRP